MSHRYFNGRNLRAVLAIIIGVCTLVIWVRSYYYVDRFRLPWDRIRGAQTVASMGQLLSVRGGFNLYLARARESNNSAREYYKWHPHGPEWAEYKVKLPMRGDYIPVEDWPHPLGIQFGIQSDHNQFADGWSAWASIPYWLLIIVCFMPLGLGYWKRSRHKKGSFGPPGFPVEANETVSGAPGE
jgi:hypothetical protein